MNPFRDAESAWLWYCITQQERWNGLKPTGAGSDRPCDIDDIASVFMRLMRQGRLSMQQSAVMLRYGFNLRAPDRRYEPRQLQLWVQGLDALHTPLAEKGIVEVAGELEPTH